MSLWADFRPRALPRRYRGRTSEFCVNPNVIYLLICVSQSGNSEATARGTCHATEPVRRNNSLLGLDLPKYRMIFQGDFRTPFSALA